MHDEENIKTKEEDYQGSKLNLIDGLKDNKTIPIKKDYSLDPVKTIEWLLVFLIIAVITVIVFFIDLRWGILGFVISTIIIFTSLILAATSNVLKKSLRSFFMALLIASFLAFFISLMIEIFGR